MSRQMHNVAEDAFQLLADSDKQCPNFSHSDRERFWRKVRVTPTCWLWTGCFNPRNGYGQFTAGGRGGGFRNYRTHRVAWELTNGPIPESQHVLHSCDVPACVNPAHLFLGTHRDNMADAARKGRLHVARPTRQKLTDAQVSHIRVALASGARQVDLAHQYDVTKALICSIANGRRRQYVRPSGDAA